jgi:predicted O-methyltransferase YrrM
MNGITYPDIEKYLYELLPPRDPLLVRLEQEAQERDIPIVGPLVGRLLALLVRLTRAKKVLEIGTAIGYSTIWLARACVLTVESSLSSTTNKQPKKPGEISPKRG